MSCEFCQHFRKRKQNITYKYITSVLVVLYSYKMQSDVTFTMGYELQFEENPEVNSPGKVKNRG